MPKDSSFSISMRLFILSNAFVKSIKTDSKSSPLSIACLISSVKVICASSVEYPGRNPNFCGEKSRIVIRLLYQKKGGYR